MKMHHCPTLKLPPGSLRPRPLVEEEEELQDPVSEWYGEFKYEYKSVRASWGDPVDLATMERRDVKKLYQDMFPDGIRDRMRFVGIGTKRISFVSDANICYKFQYNDFGDQNMQEIREGLAHPDLCCFTKLFDHAPDGLSLACEAAEAPEERAFYETFTQSPQWIQDQLTAYATGGESRGLEMMLDPETELLNEQQALVVKDLMKFQREIWRTQKNLLRDINHADNWGLTYRKGMPVLLVTDYGL